MTMTDTRPPVALVVTDEMVLVADLEVDRLEKELDITNADHIALWLASAGPMPISFLACRIADAYDRASAAASGEVERLRAANEKMKATMQEVRLIAVDAQLRATYQRTALERISAQLRTALEGSAV